MGGRRLVNVPVPRTAAVPAPPAVAPPATPRTGTDAGLPARRAPTGVLVPVPASSRQEPATWGGWHLAADPPPRAAIAAPVAGGAVVLAGGAYLGWRAVHLPGTGVTGAVCFAAELALYLSLAVLAVLTSRVNRRFERRPPAPAGTLDVFVVARGEPLAEAERTLRSARAVAYPHRTYLLADSRVDAAVGGGGGGRALDALAHRLGATCLRRGDGSPSRPSLLNHALAHSGGDAVLVLDVGDAVTPAAGHQLLGYLRNGEVGVVAADWERAGGPLLVSEHPNPALARVVALARDRDGAAPGTGSGTLYRRTALETVGGFSERGGLEEPRTSYELHAAGWASVHHPAVVATRAARPPSVAVRLTVVRGVDRLRILLFDNPLAKCGLTRWQRAHHLLEAAVPLLLAAQAGLWLGPVLAVLAGGRLADGAGTRGWLCFGLPYLVVTLAFGAAMTAGSSARDRLCGLAGYAASIPLSLVSLVLVAVRGGRVGLAPDLAPGVLASGRSGQGAVPARLIALGWTPLLLPVALGGAGLAAAVVVAAARPGRVGPVLVLWAGAVLLAAAEPVAVACLLPCASPTARRRLRAVVGASVAFAVVLTAVMR